MRKLLSLIAAVMVFLIGLGNWNIHAQNLDFGRLVFGGSVGALVGGVGGALGVYAVCITTAPRGSWADLACLAGALLFGYVPGIPIGATVGVGLAGSLQKVKGNVWFALVGASLGGAVAFFTSDWALRALSQTPQAQEIVDVLRPIVLLGVIPVSAGWGAAWGYSVGAQKATD